MLKNQKNTEAECCIVVGNWATEPGESLTDIVNRHSGFDADSFAFIAHDAASRHGFSLYAVTDEGNTLVFRGPSSRVKLVCRDMGPRFSVADTDEENAARYIIAVESAAFDPAPSPGIEERCAGLAVYRPHLDA